MRWLFWTLILIAPFAYAQDDDDDDDDESSIEIESDEPEDEPEAKKPTKKPTTTRRKKPSGKGEWVLLQDSRKFLSLQVPDTWSLEEGKSTERLSTFNLELPTGEDKRGTLSMEVTRFPEDIRGYPGLIRRQAEANESVTDVRIRTKHLPHTIYDRETSNDTFTVIQAYHLHQGRTIILTLMVAHEQLEAVYERFLKGALTVQVDLPPWPGIPSNYKTSTKRGLRYATHPSVKGSIKHFQSVTQATQKNFEKFHGKLPKPAKGCPAPIIFIHNSHADATTLAPGIRDNPRLFVNESTTMRFFATPVAKGDVEGSHKLATAFGHFLTQRKYGAAVPRWVLIGEINAAGVEHDTGKKLPWITPGHRAWSDGIDLPSLDGYKPDGGDTVARVTFFYVGFFRAGGAKYKKAYRAYLTDIATRYDSEAAAKRHLEPLGYARIRAAATKFMHSGYKVTK